MDRAGSNGPACCTAGICSWAVAVLALPYVGSDRASGRESRIDGRRSQQVARCASQSRRARFVQRSRMAQYQG
eukprot:scaffold106584_cov31-Tisochrysis_lutea.AAC.3